MNVCSRIYARRLQIHSSWLGQRMQQAHKFAGRRESTTKTPPPPPPFLFFSSSQHKIHLCYWFCTFATVGSLRGKKKFCKTPRPSPILFFNPHTPQDFQGWSFHYSQVLFSRDLVTLPPRNSSSAFPICSRFPFPRGAPVEHTPCSGGRHLLTCHRLHSLSYGCCKLHNCNFI
jgi:hypothetical protein